MNNPIQPITNILPKWLVPVAGKPMLYYWHNLFRKYGIIYGYKKCNYLESNEEDINKYFFSI